MKNLVPYGGDAFAVYNAIVEKKQHDETNRKETLAALRDEIAAHYAAYAAAARSLETMKPYGYTGASERALMHCYEVETAPLAKLKADIREAQEADLAVCAYCGIGEIVWDHYLPISLFPEFGVYGPNLIPCCDPCNRRRSDVWLFDDGRRTILNVYYDDIPQGEVLLEATITMDSGLPRVTFCLLEAVAAQTPFGRFFALHCDRLELVRRFQDRARYELGWIQRQVQRIAMRRNTREVQNDLADQAVADGRAYGVNNHRVVLLRAASRSSEFIEHCMNANRSDQGGEQRQSEASKESETT